MKESADVGRRQTPAELFEERVTALRAYVADPARLSVPCSLDRHDVCRKQPCPCCCHATDDARETS